MIIHYNFTYEKTESVWSSSSWYKHSYNYIDNYINNSEIVKSNYILNAGSAGNAYSLKCRMHHIDIAKNKIENCKEYTVGSIEKIPSDDCVFDGVLCVGSVINYTDAQFWAPESPLSPGYAYKYGVDFKDTDYVIKGKLDPNADFITRSAPGLGNNSGGAIEIVTNPNGVKLDSFNMIGE